LQGIVIIYLEHGKSLSLGMKKAPMADAWTLAVVGLCGG